MVFRSLTVAALAASVAANNVQWQPQQQQWQNHQQQQWQAPPAQWAPPPAPKATVELFRHKKCARFPDAAFSAVRKY